MSLKRILFLLILFCAISTDLRSQQTEDLLLLKKSEKWLFETMLEFGSVGKSATGYLIFSSSKGNISVEMLTSTDETLKRFIEKKSILIESIRSSIKDTVVIPFFVLSNSDNRSINFDEFPNKLTSTLHGISIYGKIFTRPLVVGISTPRK